MRNKIIGWSLAFLCILFLVSPFIRSTSLDVKINPGSFLLPLMFGYFAYYFLLKSKIKGGKNEEQNEEQNEGKSDINTSIKVLIYIVEGFLCLLIPTFIFVLFFEDSGETIYSLIFVISIIITVWLMPSPEKVVSLFKKNKNDEETDNTPIIYETEQTTEYVSDNNEIRESNQNENVSLKTSKVNKIINFLEDFDNVNHDTVKTVKQSTNQTEMQMEKQHINQPNKIKTQTVESNNNIQFSKNKTEGNQTIKSILNRNNFTKRIFELNTGVLRLLITVGVIFSFFISVGFIDDFWEYFPDDLITVILYSLLIFIGYWIGIRVILWIYDGFTKDNK